MGTLILGWFTNLKRRLSYKYTYIYIYIYIYYYIHIYTCMCIYIYTCEHIHKSVYIYNPRLRLVNHPRIRVPKNFGRKNIKQNEHLAMSRFDFCRLVNHPRLMGTNSATMIGVKKKSILNNQPAAGAEKF